MPDLLFEIGTEELPPSAVESGAEQLRNGVVTILDDVRLTHGDVEVFATPRRLAVLVRDVAAGQEPRTTERRGPPVDRCFDADGKPTQAAVGFARGAGVEPADLQRRKTEQGEYVFATISEPGRPASEVLPEALSGLVSSLSFPRTMRWDASGVRFPRPIRWLVALHGSEVLDVRHGSLVADRLSVGHRVSHPGQVEIAEASAYEQALNGAGVIASRSDRRARVMEQANQAASRAGGEPILHAAVVDEVTDIVEQPVAMTGTFDPVYLELPSDVLVTAMEAHQRYFGISGPEGGLAPGFVVISNADPANERTIVAGNERVLRARLEDARFFFAEDRKISMMARADRLGEVVVHPKLGTLRDKSLRLEELAASMARWMGLGSAQAELAGHAGRLAKADLLTHLVFEFPELQGTMGGHYARIDEQLIERVGDGIENVAAAIAEQYLPRGADDDLPQTPEGQALALSDRLDTLVGYVGIGLAPTGSEDPYALRRAATGFVSISLATGSSVPIADAIEKAWTLYRQSGVELAPHETVATEVRAILAQRAEAQLREDAPRILLQAALSGPWTDLPDLAVRARALRDAHRAGSLHQLAVVHERCFNLSRKGPHGDVDESLCTHDAEKALLAAVRRAEGEVLARAEAADYAGALEALAVLAEPVETFFDRDRGVLVMVEDDAVRTNRQALLEQAASLFAPVADFSVINPADLEARN